jgi:23S rRNA pseudouridine1911/1915/1917 synthase
MCYAKNQPSAARLSKQRSEQVLHKTYYAVAKGIFAKKQGTLEYRLEKVEGYKDRKISEEGQLCITDYKVIQEYGSNSLLEVSIRTGRTHQIRAGMASIGHPLLGDSLYGGKSNAIARPALHCIRVTMKQPFNGKEIAVEAPMPQDMQNLLK